MGYRVGLTDAAQADLATVARFLAEKSPEAATRVGNELLDAAFALTLSLVEVRPSESARVCANFRTAIT